MSAPTIASANAKTCAICGKSWTPKTRYQATRNKTCSRACANEAVSRAKRGKPSGRRVEWVKLTCTICGKAFERTPAWVRHNVSEPMCSRECNGVRRGAEWAKHGHKGRAGWTDASRASYTAKMTGARNPAWKGGVTYRHRKGNYELRIRYVRAPVEMAPMARKDGYVMEHRLVMARMVGRLLTRMECVHHRDCDPLNNEPTNLELWPTNADHKRGERGRFVEGVANRWCPRVSARL